MTFMNPGTMFVVDFDFNVYERREGVGFVVTGAVIMCATYALVVSAVESALAYDWYYILTSRGQAAWIKMYPDNVKRYIACTAFRK